MKNIKKFVKFIKQDLFFVSLICTLFILVVLFFSSFVNNNKVKNRNVIQSALVNKKYEIEKIAISENKFKNNKLVNEQIIFCKFQNFWGSEFINADSTNFDNQNIINFPVEQNLIESFIAEAKNICSINVVQNFKTSISKQEIQNQYKTFGLLEEDAIKVTFFDKNQNQVSTLFFGYLNQSKDKIFFRTQKALTVYSIDSKILSFLETDKNFWADKNLIPTSIFSKLQPKDIQNIYFTKFDSKNNKIDQKSNNEAYEKILSLRFSKLIDSSDFEKIDKPCLEIKVLDGNSNEFLYNFTPIKTNEGDCYLSEIFITPQFSFLEEERNFVKKLNYKTVISAWTYNSILKMLSSE